MACLYNWRLQVKIQEAPGYFWNQTKVEIVRRYRLQYHALLNMYRLKNEEDGVVHNFSTLVSALELMSVVSDLPLINKDILDSAQQYLCLVKLNFERDALPLPLRPFAYIDPQWYLSSDWTSWSLKNKITSKFILVLILFGLILLSLQLMSSAMQESSALSAMYSWLLLFNALGSVVLLILVVANIYALVQHTKRREAGSRLARRMVSLFVVLALALRLLCFLFFYAVFCIRVLIVGLM